jgi:hypothetical protein
MRFLLLLFSPVFSFGQAPKDANTIIVEGVSFNDICIKILESGYGFEQKDKELQYLRTEPILYKKYWNGAYKINVRVKDSVAYFTGIAKVPYDTDVLGIGRGVNNKDRAWSNSDRIRYQTNKKGQPLYKSAACHPFLLMNDFVKSFGKPVTYAKQ